MTQTQTNTPAPSIAWCLSLQMKLMAALDAAWAILDHSDDPAEIRRARDKAKGIGEIAVMARKVALITPTARKSLMDAVATGLNTTKDVADLGLMARTLNAAVVPAVAPVMAPVAAQAEIARRALDKLKGGRRGRL